LGGSSVRSGFVNAATGEVAQLVGVDVIAGVAFGAFAESFRIEPGLAQANIGNSGARVDTYSVCESQMVHDAAPRSTIADEVNAMSAHEGEFADQPLKFGDAFLTLSVVRADGGDAGRQTETAGGLGSHRR